MPRHLTVFPGGESLARRVTAQAGDLSQIGREVVFRWTTRRAVFKELVEQSDLDLRQRQFWRRCLRAGSVDHRQPKDSPAQNAEDRYQVDQSLCCSQFRLLCSAARLQDLGLKVAKDDFSAK